MSDEELIQQDDTGVEEGVSDADSPESPETAESTADVTEERQPSSKSKPVNLDEFEEFKRYKASVQQKEAQLQNQLAAERKRADEAAMAKMNESEKLAYQLKRTQEELRHRDEELRRQQQISAQAEEIRRIQSETGAPLDVLDLSGGPRELYTSAMKWLKDNATQSEKTAAKKKQAKAKANSVDLGSGTPSSAAREFDKQADEYKKANDAVGLIRHIMSARG